MLGNSLWLEPRAAQGTGEPHSEDRVPGVRGLWEPVSGECLHESDVCLKDEKAGEQVPALSVCPWEHTCVKWGGFSVSQEA